MTARLRFAPSPTGRLHLGHAYSALLNDAVARQLGGGWVLRIEDIDPVRATPERIAAVEADLRWLGLDWPDPPRRQSQHLADYAAAAERLRERELIYPCFCSRGDVVRAVAAREIADGCSWPRDPDGAPLYPGTCRTRPASVARDRITGRVPHVWRLDVAEAVARHGAPAWHGFAPDRVVDGRPLLWGDVVLVRRDVPTSYHLSVVHDDAAQRITHVVRGRDLEAATDVHALLARCLGLPSPRYHHHRLLLDEDGRKLAKSRGSASLADLRAAGVAPAAIRQRLGFA